MVQSTSMSSGERPRFPVAVLHEFLRSGGIEMAAFMRNRISGILGKDFLYDSACGADAFLTYCIQLSFLHLFPAFLGIQVRFKEFPADAASVFLPEFGHQPPDETVRLFLRGLLLIFIAPELVVDGNDSSRDGAADFLHPPHPSAKSRGDFHGGVRIHSDVFRALEQNGLGAVITRVEFLKGDILFHNFSFVSNPRISRRYGIEN